LKRATSFEVRVGAAATVVIYSLDALMSPPVQRGGITQFVTLNPESDPNEVTPFLLPHRME
jgi:hypothetical protein